MRTIRRTLVLSTLAWTVCAQVQSLQPLTIEQAVAEAIENNLSILAEKYTVPMAEARRVTAALRPNPVLSVGADHLDALGTGYDAENAAGPPEYSARTDFVFETGSKRRRRIEVAEAGVSVAQLNLLNTVRTVVLEVQTTFVDLLLAKAELNLQQETHVTFHKTVEVNTARVQQGDLAEAELIRTQVAELQLENTLLNARLKVDVARLRLQALLGRKRSDKLVDASGSLRREPVAIPVEVLRTKAFAARPDYLALHRENARTRAELRLQLAQGVVDYTLGTEYRRQQGLAGRGNSLGFFFSSSLPVFNRNQGEIERARQEQLQTSARILALQSTIENDVEIAWLQNQAARESLRRVEEKMMAKAIDIRLITQQAYHRGTITFVEFLDAQRAYYETIQARIAAMADYAKSLYQMDAATGGNVTGPGIP
jgi:cobalt-zinc-cadmium efflux system outer membrane protein